MAQKIIKNQKEEKHHYYIGISDPKQVRKEILESSKKIILALQDFEDLKKIRVEKQAKIYELKKQIIEIRRLINEMKRIMPKLNAAIHAKEEPPIVQGKTSKKNVKQAPPKRLNELDKLEDELSQIETKLQKLD